MVVRVPRGPPGRGGAGRAEAPAPEAFLFELSGGATCLDLANTVDKRPTPEAVDRLTGYGDLVSWARQAGLVDRRNEARLLRRAGERPRQGARALRRARELREALFALFLAAAEGREAPEEALRVLNTFARQAMAGRRLVPEDGGYAWRREDPREALDAMLHPVVESACELMVSGDLGRVRRCEAPDCQWLFLDTSRNRSRRWCDMAVCGNRAKARRHYARSRGSGGRNKKGGRHVSS